MNIDEQYRQRVEERAMEMIRSGEFDNLVIPDRDARLGRNNQDDRSLRCSIRDIPTFDGNGDSLPQTHMLEFSDFLANTGSEIRYLPQEIQQMIENITWQWLKMQLLNSKYPSKASLDFGYKCSIPPQLMNPKLKRHMGK